MNKIIFLFLFISTLNGFSQKDRYHFAETYIGFGSEFVSENGRFSHYNKDGIKQTSNISSVITPRILIGGTHFWGHADFYVSFPLPQIRLNGSKELFTTTRQARRFNTRTNAV